MSWQVFLTSQAFVVAFAMTVREILIMFVRDGKPDA
jgi:hypothetical protein